MAAARKAAGVTQASLARDAELDRTAVSKIESGRRAISSLELVAIARALGRPLQWFLDESVEGAGVALRDLRRRRRSILRVAEKHGADAVRVFGSVARGEERPDSDVDLLVRLERGRSLMDQAALILELRRLLGRNVDVITEGGLRERIRDRVLREAVSL